MPKHPAGIPFLVIFSVLRALFKNNVTGRNLSDETGPIVQYDPRRNTVTVYFYSYCVFCVRKASWSSTLKLVQILVLLDVPIFGMVLCSFVQPAKLVCPRPYSTGWLIGTMSPPAVWWFLTLDTATSGDHWWPTGVDPYSDYAPPEFFSGIFVTHN